MTGTPLVAATAPGPLTGHTVAVKDLYAVAGFAIGGGVRDYLGDPEPEHAAVVAAMLAAGAEVSGIAHTDEFAYSITGSNGSYGMPVNPAAPRRIPGGSSSGSAVAVARGEVTIGLGTDTAGSIRVPAAYQGLWGIRTTHGRIPTRGLLPLAQSFDTVGWITRDAETLAAVADCLLPRGAHSASGLAAAEVAARGDSAPTQLVFDRAICDVADPPLAAAAISLAETLGAEELRLDADLETWFTAFRTVQAYEAWTNHGSWITDHPNSLTPEVAQRFSYAATITPAAVDRSRRTLIVATDHLRAALSGRALMLPTTATHPPERTTHPTELEAGRIRTLRLTCLASLAGLPAVTMPPDPIDGLPIGWCLIGSPDSDQALIRLAHRIAVALS
ncbi:amidase family protein [Nocardia sp. SYP-A9097]|uniref:amidase family protein n=1 Tax=Nocardia sp. SYP-A9097 TaxID=2663237 RepID=UPI0028150E47|nr:amidase family protein [Nocardia sp. SYP-A9097]